MGGTNGRARCTTVLPPHRPHRQTRAPTPIRFLLHIPRGTIKVVLYAAFFATLTFFGLTRTQVGREGVRKEIEARFRSAYAGSIQIGDLSGNLVYSFVAENVSLFDPDGRLIGHIDTVRAEPSWESLFLRQLRLNSIELRGLVFDVLRNEQDRWNVGAALATRSPTDSVKAPFGLIAPDVRIARASISLRNRGSVPTSIRHGLVADYLNESWEIQRARFVVDWEGDVKQVDVVYLDGSAPARNINIQSFQSQVLLEDSSLTVNELSLETDGSRIDLTGRVDIRPYRNLAPGALRPFDARIRATPLSSFELSSFLPLLPIADAVVVEAELSSDNNVLVVSNASVTRGQSALQGAGIVESNSDSVRFDIGLSSPRLAREDLVAIAPTLPWADWSRVDSARGEIWVQGRVPRNDRRAIDADIQTDITTSDGGVSASGSIRIADRHVASFSLTSAISDLNLSAFGSSDLPTTSLTGSVDAYGTGTTAKTFDGEIGAKLSPSLVNEIAVDTLTSRLTGATGKLSLTTDARIAGGTLRSISAYDLTTQTPSFDSILDVVDLDPRVLASGPLDGSRINARLTLSGSGHDLADLNGTLTAEVDSSTIQRPGFAYQVSPFASRAILVQAPSRGAELTLSGGPVSGTLTAASNAHQFIQRGRIWVQRFQSLADAVGSKRYLDRSIPKVVRDSVVVATTAPTTYSRADSLFSFSVSMVDPALFAALLGTSGSAARLQLTGKGMMTSDDLSASSEVTADSVAFGSFDAQKFMSELTLKAGSAPTLMRSLQIELSSGAETAGLGRQRFVSPRFTMRHREGTGSYRFQSDEGSRLGPVNLRAQLTTLGTSNRLIIDEARARVGKYELQVETPNYVDIYADALVARRLAISSRGVGSRRQRLEVNGVYSSVPGDTLEVMSENIELRQLSDFLAVREPIGGVLNGVGKIAQSEGRPIVSGDADLASLSLGPRLLGNLNVRAALLPGTSTVAVEAALSPASVEDTLGTGLAWTLNRLDANGRIDFASGSTGPALALDANIDRADLFFFEYIFPHTIEEVQGLVRGRGKIQGTWFDPTFLADLEIADGSFSVPDFQLAYKIDGSVEVDDSGVHITSAQLRDDTGGTASLGGSVLFNRYRYFSLALTADLSNLQIMNVEQSEELPFFGHIWSSGRASLTGPISNATLRSADAQTTPESVLFIPLVAVTTTSDASFIVFADSTGNVDDGDSRRERRNVLDSRPPSERTFLDGLDIDLNVFAPQGSTVNLVIDPLLGDVMNAVGTGRVQIIRREGEFSTFGSFEVNSGDYLFTAGDVFVRRFSIDSGGSLTWDGDPTNAILNVPASYETRASAAGLPGADGQIGTIPLIVRLLITGRVATPEVSLSLEVDRTNRALTGSYQALEAVLNQPARATEYATSVLVTNSFLLTTSDASSTAIASSAFNSVSQLVASQINRYLNEALPNVDFSFGVQGESAQELGVTYGIALRLLDERLIIRGRGVYQGSRLESTPTPANQSLEGEFVVELRLSPTVSVEAFYRREGDVLAETATTTGSTGAGVSYQTEFSSWRNFLRRLFGGKDDADSEQTEPISTNDPAKN
ncbi:MAG: translocation/assembly module TamB domain-containing protein [Rhodothermales bacterium]